MRQSSSETGAAIIKGSSSGQAQTYIIRIMACLASIVPAATQAADVGRITVLTLRRNCNPDAKAQFEFLQRTAHELLTDEWTAALRARTVLLIPTIKKNVKTFVRAAAGHVGNARAGDQLGTLLAGAYSLFSSSEISPEEAAAWIQKQDWGTLAPTAADTQADEHRCLAAILETTIRVDAGRGIADMSIGEVIGVVSGRAGGYNGLDASKLGQALGRTGLKVKTASEDLLVSNNHREIGKILRDTPWSKNWDVLLLRLPGTERAGAVYFSGSTSRAVSVPLDTVFPALED
jgi:putative DNA primase/helicase